MTLIINCHRAVTSSKFYSRGIGKIQGEGIYDFKGYFIDYFISNDAVGFSIWTDE